MSRVFKIKASNVGVRAVLVKGMENHGLCYFVDAHQSNAVGGQCSHCHTIVWVDARIYPILSENISSLFGENYRKEYLANLNSFLKNLPSCPVCSLNLYDKFVNNVNYPRYADGTEFNVARDGHENFLDERVVDEDIWWCEP